MTEIVAQVRSGWGLLTLNRPKALNALSLSMIRELRATLEAWHGDPAIAAVAIRGQGREGPFGAFSAGGDIRFFHEAALASDSRLDDFFDEEYALDHLIHRYGKPFHAFMDGIVMGGGMGISQGASRRVVTERTRMAMPETNIGLFPDVGGGWFLGRCPGRIGEYLALTGRMIGGAEAVTCGLADVLVDSASLPSLWEGLTTPGAEAADRPAERRGEGDIPHREAIDRYFSLPVVTEIVTELERDGSDWARICAADLRKRSPLMLHVTLELVRRARHLTLAEELRIERGLMHHCFHRPPGTASETVEGIRAAVVDKDQAPRWQPSRIEDVTPDLWMPFFESPWSADTHPLRGLA
ncbi:MAG: enoyl-CoA hydratase/isomerase family protein [Ramlibacter sp.]